MRKTVFIFFLLCIGTISFAQRLNLTINGESVSDDKIINTIGYKKIHDNGKSIVDEINLMSTHLSNKGYIENKVLDNQKIGDSTFVCNFFLGKRIDSIHIYIGRNSILKTLSIYEKENDTIYLPYDEVEPFLKQTLSKLEKSGYALSKLNLTDLQIKKTFLIASLNLTTEKQRIFNSIVIKGYDKFPKGFKQNFIRTYKNTTFNQDNLNKIYKSFEEIKFVNQIKYPEILFEKDSTKIYVYLEKAKINTFDGFLGFVNNAEGKIIFNGFLNLNLTNTLNSGEILSIFWKNDGSGQKSFNGNIELPYIFRSPLGIKANLNIFKQDSIFQNTKTAINLGYYFKYNSRLFLGYQSTESSAIQNLNTPNLSDYQNHFLTSSFEFYELKKDSDLFPIKSDVFLKFGVGNRNSQTATNNQFFVNINLDYNYYINKRNILNIRSQNYYLQSDEYLINELYRFGGINSIQGFREDSLQGNLFTSILTQYRYLFSANTYIYSIIDYGYYQDKSTNNEGRLFSAGIGFGLLTKNGLFNLSYVSGSSDNQGISFSNSLVNVSFKTIF